MTIQMIPLNLLTIAPENVRKTAVGVDDTLVALIRAKGLLQNLVVRPNVAPKGKKKGQPAGTYAVVAGGRRLQALQLLAEEGHHPPDLLVPCNVIVEDGIGVSLAENIGRKAMEPLDEFDAFSALVDGGQTPDDVARQFGVTVLHVRQRMKLGRVSPVIRAAFRDGAINLDALKAYTLTDDFEAQEAVFRAGHGSHTYSIRANLTRDGMTADDPLVLYVGLPAYEAAGGIVNHDLFGNVATRIEDPALVRKLASDKLMIEADALRADGWSWIEPLYELTWQTIDDCDRLEGDGPGLPVDITAEAEALEIERDGLDPADEVDGPRLTAIDARLAEIDVMALSAEWSPEQKAKAGGWVAIDQDGSLRKELGFVWPTPEPEDDDADEHELSGAGGGMDGNSGAVEGADRDSTAIAQVYAVLQSEPDASSGLSFPLIEDMSAHLTAAVQVELADRPDIAYLVLLHRMVIDTICWATRSLSVDIRAHRHDPGHHGATTKQASATELMSDRIDAMRKALPEKAADIWTYLAAASDSHRAEIMALCVACTVQGVQKRDDRGDFQRAGRERLAHARHIAGALGLDMADWWRPTAATYLGAVSKDLIIEALAEAGQIKPGEKLASAKKADLVALAEERLVPTAWLPAFLRTEAPIDAAAVDHVDGEEQALAAE